MNTRTFLRVALLLSGLLLAAGCSANSDHAADATPAAGAGTTAPAPAATPAATASANFTEGSSYVLIKQPAGQAAPTGPVELVEAFSYGCPHCAHFAPYMDKLRDELPANVSVRYVPVVFSPAWEPFARAFYAARQLGVLDRMHDTLFKAVLEHYPLNSLADIADFFARQGVDRDKFMAAATSDATTREMASDQRREIQWGIDATPTLVVGRRASDAQDAPFVALMRSKDVGSYEELQQLGLWMVDKLDKS